MIILMGVAGSGKSMQGRLQADEHGYAWISTGEILRVLITGKRRQEMLQGKLLSDEEMVRVLDTVFEVIDTKQEFILDGFPRTVVQADWLLKNVDKGRFSLTAVIHLNASKDVVRKRLKQRGRQDDTEEAIAKRFDEYEAVTIPIINHFRQLGVHVYDIDGGNDPATVHQEITRIIDHNNSSAG
jgi:adenylate kinase